MNVIVIICVDILLEFTLQDAFTVFVSVVSGTVGIAYRVTIL